MGTLTVAADSAQQEHGENGTSELLTDRELRSQVQQALDRLVDLAEAGVQGFLVAVRQRVAILVGLQKRGLGRLA